MVEISFIFKPPLRLHGLGTVFRKLRKAALGHRRRIPESVRKADPAPRREFSKRRCSARCRSGCSALLFTKTCVHSGCSRWFFLAAALVCRKPRTTFLWIWERAFPEIQKPFRKPWKTGKAIPKLQKGFLKTWQVKWERITAPDDVILF